jgi:hypothetical protein
VISTGRCNTLCFEVSRRVEVDDGEVVGVAEVVHCAAVPGWCSGAWDRPGDGPTGPHGSDSPASAAGVAAAGPGQSPRHLSLVEREEISRGLVQGCSLRVIASRLGREPSTVCPEVNRNGGRGKYRAAAAESRASGCCRRPKTARLAACAELREVVEGKLWLQWSPQQIARWLPTEFPPRAEMRVSHETIYLSLFILGRGALRRELAHELRRGHVHPRGSSG